jgi:hypothetical protein
MLSLVSNSRSLMVGEVDLGCQIVRNIGPRPQRFLLDLGETLLCHRVLVEGVLTALLGAKNLGNARFGHTCSRMPGYNIPLLALLRDSLPVRLAGYARRSVLTMF